MSVVVRSVIETRAARVSAEDRPALAYLWIARDGQICVGPGHDHDPQIVRALVSRLHVAGLVRGDAKTGMLWITEPGRRVVAHWGETIATALSDAARERVLEAEQRWLGAPSLPVDEELERHGLVRRTIASMSKTLHFLDYSWRTDLCVVVARTIRGIVEVRDER